MWDRGEQALAEVLDRRGLCYESAAGEGAFYGPKIDVQILDPAGRESTLSTVQLDFYQPRQFGLAYVAADQSLQRPVMIHRSIVGSLERLVAHLTEVHAGAFPTWMAPVQVVVLPVACQQLPAAASLLRRFIHAGLRAEISDPDRGTLGARIRSHRLVAYQAIVGARETANDTVSLRLRTGLALDPIPARAATILTVALGAYRLAELYQVAVWVAQEAADLRAPVVRRGEERCAPRPQRLVRGLAVSHPQGHGVTDLIGVGGRPEDHGRLVGGRAAPAHQQKPGTGETQHHAGSPVLAVQLRAQHTDPEIPRPRWVGDHQDVRDRDVGP